MGLGATPIAGRRRKRKHKHKRPKRSTPSLAKCRSACGETCDCYFTPAGDILCGDAAGIDTTCTETCRSGSDCAFGTCITSFFAAGESTLSSFPFTYPVG